MVQLTRIGNSTNVPVKEWTCETYAEVQSLDTPWGSLAYCIASKKWYIKGSDGNWKEYPTSSGGGGTEKVVWEALE